MRLAAAFLADHASVREGLLFVTGGGISQVISRAFPVALPASLALLAEIPPETVGSFEFDLEVKVRRQGDRKSSILKGQVSGTMPDRAVGTRIPIAIDLRFVSLASPGVYLVDVRLGRRHVRLGFEARPLVE